MKRINTTCILIATVFALNITQISFAQSVGATNGTVSSTADFSGINQDFFAQVEGLIQQGRQQGVNYLNSKDEKIKKSAKKSLDEAENLLKKKLKQEPGCEKCLEFLTMTNFYQTTLAFPKITMIVSGRLQKA